MRFIIGLFIYMLFFQSNNLQSQTKTRYERIDSLLTKDLNEVKYSGNILLIENGKELYFKSFGYADLNDKRPVDRNSKFDISSISKQFTGYAILLLQQRGKLEFEDELGKHIPELAFYKGITINHLLYQTSGLFDYELFLNKYGNRKSIATNEDVIQLAAREKLILFYDPGRKFMDNNVNYMLLGSMVERITKMPLEEFLNKEVFQPLKMDNTFLYRGNYDDLKTDNLATSFEIDKNGHKAKPTQYTDNYASQGVVGAERVFTTVDDMFLWDTFLKSKDFPESFKNLMFTSGTTTSGSKEDYGIGWHLSNVYGIGEVARHGGLWGGYAGIYERHLEKGISIIAFTNGYEFETFSFLGPLRELLHREPE